MNEADHLSSDGSLKEPDTLTVSSCEFTEFVAVVCNCNWWHCILHRTEMSTILHVHRCFSLSSFSSLPTQPAKFYPYPSSPKFCP